MRKDRERKKRKARLTLVMLFLAIAAIVLGFVLVQNFGILQRTNPFGQSGSGSSGNDTTAQNTSAPTTTAQGGSSGSLKPGEASSSTSGQEGANGDETEGEEGHGSAADPVKVMLENMSLEEKVGQLVVVGVDGYNNDEHSKLLMETYHIGGFILFKKNIQDSNQLLKLINSLKKTNASQNGIPLFMSVDEEGGRVSRLPEEFKKFPANKIIGKKNDTNLSYNIGGLLGEELRAFGFNMDFAPVLDINSNPKNPVIGDRAFGTTPDIVSRLGIQTMKGIQSQKVISVVKHFPGHGDTSVDSHVGLPRVNYGLDRLESFELVPFKEAIENGADTVMVAHILLPKLDAKNPASFSKAVITDLLRDSLGYNGVVITDDFTMGAITENYDMGLAAVKSIQAGGDIVLVCHGFEKQETVIKALLQAARTGQISAERLDESAYRVLQLKQKYALADTPAGPVDVQGINKKISELLK